MKRIMAVVLLTLSLSACGVHQTAASPIYGPTVDNPQPLTDREQFILAYRTVRPGDTKTDDEVFALIDSNC